MKQEHMILSAIGLVAIISIIISSYVLMNKKENFAASKVQSYCAEGIDVAKNITPEFMEYCKDACHSNGTLMGPLCECSCARAQPYVMSFDL